MEFIEIAEGKWKIMLTKEDMVYYKLDLKYAGSPTEETKAAFFRVMDEIRAKSGKTLPQGQLTVEIYESIGGGCEMFVTRSGEKSAEAPKKRKLCDAEKRETVYFFDAVDPLVTAAKKLSGLGYREESRLYAVGEKQYYLVVRERHLESAVVKNEIGEYAFLSEYGHRKSGAYLLPYIREHGKAICAQNAVSWLANL